MAFLLFHLKPPCDSGEKRPVRLSKSKQLLHDQPILMIDPETHTERRVPFRHGRSRVPNCSGFMGASRFNRW